MEQPWSRVSRSPVDSPLKRRRLQLGITQAALGQRCQLSRHAIAKYEQLQRVPRAQDLVLLMAATGLSAEAIVLPYQYLTLYPSFLQEYATPAKTRGRPRHQ